MMHKCPACGCSCGYDKHDAVKDVTSHQPPLKTHNLYLEGSALLQNSALPLSAALLTSTQRTDAASERTNELSEACLATDVIQGCTLDVIQSRLHVETLPGGFVCNRMFDKILLYKLDISKGVIAVECGIILTSDFQLTCSSYNEVLPVNLYEDLLSQGKQITRVAQLLTLMVRLGSCRQAYSHVKTESDVGCCDENYRAMIEAFETKLEAEESAVCIGSEDLITQSSLSKTCLSAGCESHSIAKCKAETYTTERSAGSNCVMADVIEEGESGSETSDADSTVTRLTDVKSTTVQGVNDACSATDSTVQKNRCPVCLKSFSHFRTLQQHIQHRHVNDGQHCCTLCQKSFSARSGLWQHMKGEHGESKYRCDRCDYSSKYLQNVNKHISVVHLDKKSHKCPQCYACFSQKAHLTQHTSTVHNHEKPFECSSCNTKFTEQRSRDRHWRTVHCGEKPFSCDQCDYKSTRKDKLTKHQRTVHDEKKLIE